MHRRLARHGRASGEQERHCQCKRAHLPTLPQVRCDEKLR
jgi:hypothetical protein